MKSLNPKQFYFGLIGVLVVLGLLSIGVAVMGNNILTQKNQKLTELKLDNEVLTRQNQDVITAKANIEKYKELEAVAKQIVPQEKDQARTVRELIRFAQVANIGIGSISFPASTLGKQPVAAPKAEGGGAAAKPAQPTTTITQVTPVAGTNGVFELEVVVTSAQAGASFDSLVRLLKSLESNRRTSQVSEMVITPDSKNRNQLSFTINVRVYIKP